ncbi:MAG: lipopolysaccharide heptosyltransferase II [Woeseia sp.]
MPCQPILIVGPSWVGDMVMAQSLFMLLHERRPETPLDVLAPAWSLPMIARMSQVRRGIVAAGEHGEIAFGKRRALATGLRAAGYSQAIVLPRSLKSALVPWLARIPRRTGFRGEMRLGLINDTRKFDAGYLDQTVKRFLALGLDRDERISAVPEPRLEVDESRQQQILARLGLNVDRPVIALMPGAEYGPAKCWPLAHFRVLAEALEDAGYSVWVLGSGRDMQAGAAICAGGNARNLCGQTSLEDAIDLLAACEQAVSNDSGLMHVAAAVGIRIIALYGSTTPDFTPPLTAKCKIHYLQLECSPCFARECPLGHFRCLREITPQAVLATVLGARN